MVGRMVAEACVHDKGNIENKFQMKDCKFSRIGDDSL
jgi:hypothetical protein